MFFSLSISRYEREFEKEREREKSDDSATVAFVVACGSPHPSRFYFLLAVKAVALSLTF